MGVGAGGPRLSRPEGSGQATEGERGRIARVRVEERVRCSLQRAEDRAFGLATKLAGATQSVPGRRRVVESERKNLTRRVDTVGL